MMKTNITLLISELTEEERKAAEQSVEQCLGMLQFMVHQCEHYLQYYVAGKVNVAKLCGVLEQTRGMLGDASADLINRHRIPDPPKGT